MSIIETAPAYYEYGNALLRWAIRQRDDAEEHEGDGEAANDITAVASTTTCISSAEENKRSIRESIAAAAERRRQSKIEETISTTTNDENGKVKSDHNAEDADDDENNDDTTVANHDGDGDDDSGDEDDDDDDENGSLDDIQLALEMMETSWSILDAYQQHDRSEHHPNNNNNNHNRKNYDAWVMEQIPRVLTGIGDALSVLDRHADAADAYLRALDHRQTVLNQYSQTMNDRIDNTNNGFATVTTTTATAATLSSGPNIHMNHTDLPIQIQLLKHRRQVVEVTVLVVEELLSCRYMDQDVRTTESQIVLVPKGKVVEYARGYYNRARDELQETVVLLGQIAARIPSHTANTNRTASTTAAAATTTSRAVEKSLQEEKENICYVATMIMGAGTTLAEIDDERPQQPPLSSSLQPTQQSFTEPPMKKSKPSK